MATGNTAVSMTKHVFTALLTIMPSRKSNTKNIGRTPSNALDELPLFATLEAQP